MILLGPCDNLQGNSTRASSVETTLITRIKKTRRLIETDRAVCVCWGDAHAPDFYVQARSCQIQMVRLKYFSIQYILYSLLFHERNTDLVMDKITIECIDYSSNTIL